MTTFKTLADVRAANQAIGNHWFDRATMRWWKTRIESSLRGGRFFITSEDEFCIDGRRPRRVYSVREALPDGSIKTHEHYLFDKDDAREAITRRLRG